MVFKKGHNQVNGQLKDVKDKLRELVDFCSKQLTVNESFVEVSKGMELRLDEIDELGERLERTDWALLDYIKQQEHVIQSMERRLYNAEKAIIDFCSKTPEVA